MPRSGTITIVGTADDKASTRSGTRSPADQVKRVTNQLSVDELREKFLEFMQSLEVAFSVPELHTSAGAFELNEIQFSAELSANGDFKLLGTGVGVSANTALTFVLSRRDRAAAT
jgi:hypothetical protein